MTRPNPPFIDHLGARIAEHDNYIEVLLDLRPEYCNSRGQAHGGLLMTLLDVAMSRAARARRRQGGHEDLGSATIEMKTSFIKPGPGPSLVARGICLASTVSMAFCEGEVFDHNGELIAKASGSFKYVSARTKG